MLISVAFKAFPLHTSVLRATAIVSVTVFPVETVSLVLCFVDCSTRFVAT